MVLTLYSHYDVHTKCIVLLRDKALTLLNQTIYFSVGLCPFVRYEGSKTKVIIS